MKCMYLSNTILVVLDRYIHKVVLDRYIHFVLVYF